MLSLVENFEGNVLDIGSDVLLGSKLRSREVEEGSSVLPGSKSMEKEAEEAPLCIYHEVSGHSGCSEATKKVLPLILRRS